MVERPPYRLPRHIVPRRYQLEITPDLTEASFEGLAHIDLEVTAPSREIILNAVNLTLQEVTLTGPEGREPLLAKVTYHPEEEQVTLALPEEVSPGRWLLAIRYRGVLARDLRGFYRTSVSGQDGNPVVIASTHMEPTDARRVFPGWDEPDFKATFAITLVVDPELMVLSNGREISHERDTEGKKRVTFAETMPMSTYLVALIVGPFERVMAGQVGEVPIGIAARPGFGRLTQMAATVAVDTLRFFEDYFGIPYPGDKLDHVAIPEFEVGAMENLGCVTYREALLLIDPERSSPMEQLNVVGTMAHETAHMWFGDLVTMRWWNGLWLNEAFATFMQTLATDALHPEWEVWSAVTRSRTYAMMVDALSASRPIELAVGRPVEARAMFDVLTYSKGGSILRMLEQYLGPDVFRRGISQYLERHRLGNTETSDLWDALESASGQPVRAVMDSWVFQAGYPLVHAELKGDGGQLILRQQQFRYQGDGSASWKVPVVLGIHDRDGHDHTQHVLLGEEPVTVSLPQNMAWVMVNQGGWGFYRVAYDGVLWGSLTRELGQMTSVERSCLVDDVWASVLAGKVSLTQAVELWGTMADERNPDVWSAVASQMALLDVMANEDDRRVLRRLIQKIARPAFDRLTWRPLSGEDINQGRLRAILARLLGTVGEDPMVRAEARTRWLSHVHGEEMLSPEMVTPLAHVVATSGGEEEWNLMYQQFKRAETPQEETRYLYALAHFTDPELVSRTLALYQSPEVRVQNGATAMGQVLANRHARQMAWEAIEAGWDAMLERYPKAMMEAVVQPMASTVDDDLAHRMAAWFKAHPIAEVVRPVAQAIEFQGINRAMTSRIRGKFESLLADPKNP